MDIIIFGGQSNMQGQTGEMPSVNDAVEGALEYRLNENELVPLKLPVGEDLGGNKYLLGASHGCGSLIPPFCREYVKATGRQVVAISACRGDTTVEDWQKGTYRYRTAHYKMMRGIAKAKSLGEVEHIYFVWLQGESDAIIESTEEEYLERLTRLKNTLKREVGIEKFGIIKVGYFYCNSQWHKGGNYDNKKRCDETIMSAQERAAAEDSDFVMLTRVCTELSMKSEYINPEASGHYNNAAMDIIGTEAAKGLAAI